MRRGTVLLFEIPGRPASRLRDLEWTRPADGTPAWAEVGKNPQLLGARTRPAHSWPASGDRPQTFEAKACRDEFDGRLKGVAIL